MLTKGTDRASAEGSDHNRGVDLDEAQQRVSPHRNPMSSDVGNAGASPARSAAPRATDASGVKEEASPSAARTPEKPSQEEKLNMGATASDIKKEPTSAPAEETQHVSDQVCRSSNRLHATAKQPPAFKSLCTPPPTYSAIHCASSSPRSPVETTTEKSAAATGSSEEPVPEKGEPKDADVPAVDDEIEDSSTLATGSHDTEDGGDIGDIEAETDSEEKDNPEVQQLAVANPNNGIEPRRRFPFLVAALAVVASIQYARILEEGAIVHEEKGVQLMIGNISDRDVMSTFQKNSMVGLETKVDMIVLDCTTSKMNQATHDWVQYIPSFFGQDPLPCNAVLHSVGKKDKVLWSRRALQDEIDACSNLILVEHLDSVLSFNKSASKKLKVEHLFSQLQKLVEIDWNKTAVAIPGSTCKVLHRLLRLAGIPSREVSVCMKNDAERTMWVQLVAHAYLQANNLPYMTRFVDIPRDIAPQFGIRKLFDPSLFIHSLPYYIEDKQVTFTRAPPLSRSEFLQIQSAVRLELSHRPDALFLSVPEMREFVEKYFRQSQVLVIGPYMVGKTTLDHWLSVYAGMSDDARKMLFRASASPGESFTVNTVRAAFGNMTFTDTAGHDYSLNDVSISRMMCAVKGLVHIGGGAKFEWNKEECDYEESSKVLPSISQKMINVITGRASETSNAELQHDRRAHVVLYVIKYTEDTTEMREMLSKFREELREAGVEMVVAVTHLSECKYPVETCMASITEKLGLGYDETVALDAASMAPPDIASLPTFDSTKDEADRDTIADVVRATGVYLEPTRVLNLVRRLRLASMNFYRRRHLDLTAARP
eukprot:m.698372 g.698372  ORF g.698372 m.698372 type:complete len:825 (+) comp22900_c0_seq3:117-2591(+)